MLKKLSLVAISSLFATSLIADTFNLKAGWNLVGSSNSIDVTKAFNNSNIKVIWRYNNGSWQAYSPNSDIASQLNSSNYTMFSNTNTNEGFWVYSDIAQTIDFDGNTTSVATSDAIDYASEFLTNMWGFNWYKTEQLYDGDTSFQNSQINAFTDNDYIVLDAFKTDNNDSKAEIATNVNANYIKANINLAEDGNYSYFQTITVNKGLNTSELVSPLSSTSNLNLITGVNIYKNKISAWWLLMDSNGNESYHTIASKDFSQDLTNLVQDGSDVQVVINYSGDNINYSVENLEDNSTLFSADLNVSDTKVTNMDTIEYLKFRSRVDDATASANGDEALDTSENIVNDVFAGVDISSIDQFISNLDFTPVTISNDMFDGKLIVSTWDDNDDKYIDFSFLNSDGSMYDKTLDEDGNVVETSSNESWAIDNNVIVVKDENSTVEDYTAIKSINGNSITLYNYYTGDKNFELESDVILDSQQTTNLDEDVIRSYFTQSNLQDIPNLTGTWNMQLNNDSALTLTVNDDSTFEVDDSDGNVVASGDVSVDGNVATLTTNDSSDGKVYIVITNSTSSEADGYIVFTTSDASLRNVNTLKLTK